MFSQRKADVLTSSDLMEKVLLADNKNAEKLLANNPEELLIKRSHKDLSGRVIIGSPLQSILATGNFLLLPKLMPHLVKIKNGVEEALHQFNEQFVEDCFDNSSFDFSQIERAITDGRNIEEAIADFQKKFLPETVTKGMHFPLAVFIAAQKILSKQSQTWTPEQKSYFAIHVIGHLERLFTAFDGKAYIHGMMKAKKKGVLEDNFEIDARGVNLFPLDEDPNFCLGKHFAVSSWIEEGPWYFAGAGSRDVVKILKSGQYPEFHYRSALNWQNDQINALREFKEKLTCALLNKKNP